MRDAWLRQGASRRPVTWAQQQRRFRALRVPHEVFVTVKRWAGSPDTLEPLHRVIRDIVLSNAVHRARTKGARRVAGTARDPHYTLTPEHPGALRPIRDSVERVVADLERLIHWRFTPPIELHELNATLTPTGRVVRLSRLDETIRDAFETARTTLLPIRATLREATERRRGRKATLVQPFRVSATPSRTPPPTPARRRELERPLCDELLRLHPDRHTRARAARADAARVAHRLLDALL